MPVFPMFERSARDPFPFEVNSPGKQWVILVDEHKRPCMVLNANGFLREALFGKGPINPYVYCHRPILIEDPGTTLGKVLSRLKVYPESAVDDVIDDALILIRSGENG